MSARTELGQFPAKPCVDGLVKCARCHEMLPVAAFYERREKRSRLGRQSWCKKCQRARERQWDAHRSPEKKEVTRLKRRARVIEATYGITIEQYDQMLADQDGVCAICGLPQTGDRNLGRALVVDHDHASGAVRGLLCSPCNRGLGHFNDDPTKIAAALAYMERTS